MKKILNLTYTILLALALLPFSGYGQEIERSEQIFENEGGNREDEITDVITDSQGNVYIAGWFSGTISLDPDGSAAGKLTSTNNSVDMYVAKYNADGGFLGANNIDFNDLEDRANGITLSNDETRLYVVGQVEAAADNNQVYVAALSAANLQFQQSFISNAAGDERGQSVSVHSNGNVYITGYYETSFSMGAVSGNSTQGLFVVVLNGALSNVLRGRTATGTARVRCGGLDIDGNGNAYVTGEFNNTLTFPGSGSRTSNGDSDIFFANIM